MSILSKKPTPSTIVRSLTFLLTSHLSLLTLLPAADWQHASPDYQIALPADHSPHPDHQTEWWYFTGHLKTADGRPFGYQLTFFRQGIVAPEDRPDPKPGLLHTHLSMAHFAFTDPQGEKTFTYQQKLKPADQKNVGFQTTSRGPTNIAWIDDWSLTHHHTTQDTANHFTLHAQMEDLTLELELAATKPPLLHGNNGYSPKAAADATSHASHYYSFTSMQTTGRIQIADKTHSVTGQTWFDHEWSTSFLGKTQSGWDWWSLHLDDGSELMLFQVREKESPDSPTPPKPPFLQGTHRAQDGTVTHLHNADITLQPLQHWQSPHTAAAYPTHWQLEVPRLGIKLQTSPWLDDQELRLEPVSYWEGAIDVQGSHHGRGYQELTGYQQAFGK